MKNLHHVGIVVADIEKSIEFYVEQLNFILKERWVNPKNGAFIALLEQGDLLYEMIQYIENPYEGQGAYNHVALLVDHVDEWLKDLKAKGVQLDSDRPRIIMGGRARIVFCYGPDGEMIELHERGDWTDDDAFTGGTIN